MIKDTKKINFKALRMSDIGGDNSIKNSSVKGS